METAAERGGSLLDNGELLAAAEEAGFDRRITTHQNLRYQQNLEVRRIGTVVLLTISWPRIRRQMDEVMAAVDGLPPGGFIKVRMV